MRNETQAYIVYRRFISSVCSSGFGAVTIATSQKLFMPGFGYCVSTGAEPREPSQRKAPPESTEFRQAKTTEQGGRDTSTM